MFLSFNIKFFLRICLYLIFIAVCVTSWIKFLKEPTTFEEHCELKAHEKDKCVENKYNDTSHVSWYFAPQISIRYPFETVICLIWTPSRKHKLKTDWMNIVSFKIKKKLYILLLLKKLTKPKKDL